MINHFNSIDNIEEISWEKLRNEKMDKGYNDDFDAILKK
jgi:hypothetical protein